MRRMAIALLVVVLTAAWAAGAVRVTEDAEFFGRGQEPPEDQSASREVLWFDDVEHGENGWTHGDWTIVTDEPQFHLDTYMSWSGNGRSWWCGSFEYDADGGYGNNWFEYLEMPPVAVSSTGVPDGDRSSPGSPVWTFCYRHDSEQAYDFTHIQAESLGQWRTLDAFDGLSPWQDLGVYGYQVHAYDNPFRGRFLFTSDGTWSDEDGDSTAGGGFACDNVKLFDLYTAAVFFCDDGEGGGLCTPGHPEPAGDLWHIAYDLCSSYSRPHSWQCVDVADTTRLPPRMGNWLASPWIHLRGAYNATWHAKAHFEVAGYDGDYWYVWATFDGVNYYTLKANYGDFGSCAGWSASYANGVNLCTLPGGPTSPQWVQISHAMYTDSNGTLPTVGGCCGIVFDDILIDGIGPCPVDYNSWGSVKVLFR